MVKVPERIIVPLLSAIPETTTNIFALRAPKNYSAPFIIFQRVDTDLDRHLKGPSGIKQATIQIDAYAKEYWMCRSIAAQIEQILDGFIGTVDYTEDDQQQSIEVSGITCQNDIDILDETAEPILCRSTARYLISIKQ